MHRENQRTLWVTVTTFGLWEVHRAGSPPGDGATWALWVKTPQDPLKAQPGTGHGQIQPLCAKAEAAPVATGLAEQGWLGQLAAACALHESGPNACLRGQTWSALAGSIAALHGAALLACCNHQHCSTGPHCWHSPFRYFPGGGEALE